MRSVILGTAGHIDHGKTTLVKALTGIDTDRLPEEKARGISIELGFARLDVGDLRFGIIDVPGHERFVKTMLAGAGGIDLVVLVVAADEGVMPQTREHLDVIDFLGVSRGVVALTKSDLVDDETREIAALDVTEALEGTTLAGCEVIPVSAVTGAGVDELKKKLRALAGLVPPRLDSGPYRLPVDRSFVMEGFGTVVTGTGFSGSVRVGDRLDVLPRNVAARVRRVQVHGKDAEAAGPGQRIALALHGVAKEDVGRGDQLVSPGSLAPSSMVDVRLRVSPRWVRALRHRERVRFHLASSEDFARVILLDRDELEPGEDGLAQLRFETPIVPAAGDRFVIRSYSPAHTMAGGTIIDPHPKKHRRGRAEDMESIARREGGGPVALVLEKVGAAGLAGIRPRDLAASTSLAADEVEQLLRAEEETGTVKRTASGRVIAMDAWRVASRALVEHADRFREGHPLRWGATREELRAAVAADASAAVFGELLDELAARHEVALSGEKVRTGGGDVVFDGEAARERDRIADIYRAAGLQPPELSEILGRGRLAEDVVYALVDQGELERVTPDMFLHREAMEIAKQTLRELQARDGHITVGAFRDTLGISRKYAVPMLEHFDALRVTRRDGDVRHLRSSAPGGSE